MFYKPFVVFSAILVSVFAGHSPVLLWGVNSPSKPYLQTVSEIDFSETLAPVLEDSMIVAFLEPHLRSDDLSLCQLSDEKSCYSNLKDIAQKTFYADVENPINALRQLTPNREYATVNKNGQLDTEVAYEAGKILFVTFDEPSVPLERAETLELHDLAISQIVDKLSVNGKVVGVYTRTAETALVRRARQAKAETDGHIYRAGNNIAIYFKSLVVREGKEETELTFTGLTVTNNTNENVVSYNVELAGPTPVKFVIRHSQGYFSMHNLQVGSDNFPVHPPVEAPTDFSYFCGARVFQTPTSETNPDGKLLIWNNLQFQAPFNARYSETFKFGDAWHCVGFFSIGILAGLFVTILMLIILAVGICWLMDIRTMDRFDDPKGKTITINTLE